ncbi:MAG: hypothetical protein ABJL67_24210 [Sulfitobacter sp.]
MTLSMMALIAGLLLWMVFCALCGFRGRFFVFLAMLIGGLVLNSLWMVFGLDAQPFESHAVMAQGAAVIYALCAFGCGWFARRLRQAWRDSKV